MLNSRDRNKLHLINKITINIITYYSQLITCIDLTFTMYCVTAPTGPDLELLTTGLVAFVKFCFTITFYVVHLVAMETYPTCVRQTGTSLGAVMGSSMGILGPYIVYLVSKRTWARQWFQPVIMPQRWTRVKPCVLPN